MRKDYWTVAEAKAKLSEVLRLVRGEGPQRIGAENPCIVVSQEEWERLQRPTPKLGAWLVQHMPQIEGFEAPSRQDPPRDAPF